MILSLLAFALRIAFLAVFTFAFVVLYEHGPSGFVDGAAKEWNALVGGSSTSEKSPESGS